MTCWSETPDQLKDSTSARVLQLYINGVLVLKQTSYFEHCLGGPSIFKYSCGRRERRFEAGFGHSKLDQLDQRPPAATDPPAVLASMDPPAAVEAVGAISDHAYPGFFN